MGLPIFITNVILSIHAVFSCRSAYFLARTRYEKALQPLTLFLLANSFRSIHELFTNTVPFLTCAYAHHRVWIPILFFFLQVNLVTTRSVITPEKNTPLYSAVTPRAKTGRRYLKWTANENDSIEGVFADYIGGKDVTLSNRQLVDFLHSHNPASINGFPLHRKLHLLRTKICNERRLGAKKRVELCQLK